jgi:hypothetical protein
MYAISSLYSGNEVGYFICEMVGDPSSLVFGLKGTTEILAWLQGGVDRDAYGNHELLAIRSVHHVHQADVPPLEMANFVGLVALLNERHRFRAQPIRCVAGRVYTIPDNTRAGRGAYFIGPKPDAPGVNVFGLRGTPETCRWLKTVAPIPAPYVDGWLAYREARVVREAGPYCEQFDLSMIDEAGALLSARCDRHGLAREKKSF